MLTISFVLGSQQVLITKVNSHVMLCTIPALSDFHLSSLLLKYIQVNKITVQKNYRSKCDGFHCSVTAIYAFVMCIWLVNIMLFYNTVIYMYMYSYMCI